MTTALDRLWSAASHADVGRPAITPQSDRMSAAGASGDAGVLAVIETDPSVIGGSEMQSGRIGGMLVTVGVALFVIGYALMIAAAAIANMVAGAGMAVIAVGAAILCVTGPRPLQGRAIRIGLGAIAAGLTALLASAIVAGTLAYDPLEDWRFVILGLGGFLALALGLLVTAVVLLRVLVRSLVRSRKTA
jgi:MFS family permease